MGQRYTPSKLGVPIFNEHDSAGLYPSEPMFAAEYNTLLVVALFGEPGASCSIRPWVNIKSKLADGTDVDNWLPLADVDITAVDDTPNQPDSALPNSFRAQPVEIALPNCHEVQVEVLSVAAGTTTLPPTTAEGVDPGSVVIWAKPTNRAPR